MPDFTVGRGRTGVWLDRHVIGEEVLLVLGGGETPHIGGAVLKEPGKSPVVADLPEHRDLEVMIPLAESACKKLGVTVAVVGGIHLDNATKEEIETIIENCKELERCI